VPCRVTNAIPTLVNGNSTVTLSDTPDDVNVTGTNVSTNTFTTDIGGGTGSEDITDTVTKNVSVNAVCEPPGSATVNNEAHLDGASSTLTVQGPQIGTDPVTGAPIYQQFEFTCVAGVNLDDGANADVSCEAEPPSTPNACTYTQGGYQGGGVPGQIFDTNFVSTFPTGLTIGIEDGAGPRHDASWSATAAGMTALKSFLAGGGPSGALTADTLNASSVSGGALGKQAGALTLNVGFALDSNHNVGLGDLGSLQICNLAAGNQIGSFTVTATQAAALNGFTVAQILAAANDALGGNGLPGYVGSFGDLNQLVTALNEAFDNCTPSAFANAHLCKQ